MRRHQLVDVAAGCLTLACASLALATAIGRVAEGDPAGSVVRAAVVGVVLSALLVTALRSEALATTALCAALMLEALVLLRFDQRLPAEVCVFLLLWLLLRSPYRRLDRWRIDTTPGESGREATGG